MKFANQNFLSVGIFVLRGTTKFLFTLQARQIAYILLQKVLNCTLFSSIWIAFWLQTPNGGLTAQPLRSTCWNFSLNLCGSLLKRKFEPCTITAVLIIDPRGKIDPNFGYEVLVRRNLRPLLVESSVIVIFYVIFLMRYAVIINYIGEFFFQLRENRE